MRNSLVLVTLAAIACSRHPSSDRHDGAAEVSGGSGKGASGGNGGNGGAGGAGNGGNASGASGNNGGAGGNAGGGSSGASGGAGGAAGASAAGTGGAGAAGGLAGSSAGRGGAGGSCQIGCKQLGEPCANDVDCANRICVEGVCCSAFCTGACVSCTLPGNVGHCQPVAPGSPDPHHGCVASPPCGLDGRCNGSGACRYYAGGTVCAAETCSAGLYSAPRICSAGFCLEANPIPCLPYQCEAGGSRCASTCATDMECGSGTFCRNGVCRSDPAGPPCLGDTYCASGHCAQGVCCTTACPGPCSSCALPGKSGVCMPVPDPDPAWSCPGGA